MSLDMVVFGMKLFLDESVKKSRNWIKMFWVSVNVKPFLDESAFCLFSERVRKGCWFKPSFRPPSPAKPTLARIFLKKK